jgi:hypothetical protein
MKEKLEHDFALSVPSMLPVKRAVIARTKDPQYVLQISLPVYDNIFELLILSGTLHIYLGRKK